MTWCSLQNEREMVIMLANTMQVCKAEAEEFNDESEPQKLVRGMAGRVHTPGSWYSQGGHVIARLDRMFASSHVRMPLRDYSNFSSRIIHGVIGLATVMVIQFVWLSLALHGKSWAQVWSQCFLIQTSQEGHEKRHHLAVSDTRQTQKTTNAGAATT